ncbi:hypothetical protein MWU60_09285 [Yoonia sp. F2084L]|uniref:hypothetical protein n=1 Tax=Yoonia sp. F2084L TaxID=2926419 RepID=UPI001FF49855|nr:hypothetical protein [Yoonia sp. F2084L]MCK0095763.1 hypothetical protein [Yoonia sp. F2084L]
MLHALSLEAFDADLTEDMPNNPAVQQAYDDGYAAGLTAATQDQSAISAELVQHIADLEFSYSEARGDILRTLSPLLDRVVERLLPHCVAAGFATELSAILYQAATTDLPDAVSITVHPDQRAAVAAELSDYNTDISIIGDAALGPNAAWITQGTRESYLDLDALLSQITEILSTIDLTEPRIEANG